MNVGQLREKIIETKDTLQQLRDELEKRCSHNNVVATIYQKTATRNEEEEGICLICGLTEGKSGGKLFKLKNKQIKWVDNKIYETSYLYLTDGKIFMPTQDIEKLFGKQKSVK